MPLSDVQEKPKGWKTENWRTFLQVWTGIVTNKPTIGASRGGDVDKNILGNWKRHFSNLLGKPAPKTDAQLRKAKKALDTGGKELPAAMKSDIKKKRVPTATACHLPPSLELGAEDPVYIPQAIPFVQIKEGDPR